MIYSIEEIAARVAPIAEAYGLRSIYVLSLIHI